MIELIFPEKYRQRRANAYADGISRYEIPSLRDADPKAARKGRKNGPHSKFGHTKGKCATSNRLKTT